MFVEGNRALGGGAGALLADLTPLETEMHSFLLDTGSLRRCWCQHGGGEAGPHVNTGDLHHMQLKVWSRDQPRNRLGAWQESRILGLLRQSLHFDKAPGSCICTLSLEQHFSSVDEGYTTSRDWVFLSCQKPNSPNYVMCAVLMGLDEKGRAEVRSGPEIYEFLSVWKCCAII